MSILTELDLTRMEDDSYNRVSKSWLHPTGICSPIEGVRQRELIRLARLGMKYEQEQDAQVYPSLCEICGEEIIG